MNPARWIGDLVRGVILGMIHGYQRWISPLTPPSCFFYPTCSHYTYQAVERFGVWRGGWLGVRRVCRCHPLARGGYDPVPERWSWRPAKNQQTTPFQLNDVAVSDGLRDLDE